MMNPIEKVLSKIKFLCHKISYINRKLFQVVRNYLCVMAILVLFERVFSQRQEKLWIKREIHWRKRLFCNYFF